MSFGCPVSIARSPLTARLRSRCVGRRRWEARVGCEATEAPPCSHPFSDHNHFDPKCEGPTKWSAPEISPALWRVLGFVHRAAFAPAAHTCTRRFGDDCRVRLSGSRVRATRGEAKLLRRLFLQIGDVGPCELGLECRLSLRGFLLERADHFGKLHFVLFNELRLTGRKCFF